MRTNIAALAAFVTTSALVASSACAAVTELRLEKPEPFVDGYEFGGVGAYVRIKGTVKGELDPNAPDNKVIADIDKAPRNGSGLVEYETDIYILRPADPKKGSGMIFYEVNNRGRKFLVNWLQDAAQISQAAANDPKGAGELGNRFAFNRGYTLVWSGWDPDAPRNGGGMAANFPVATENGQPIVKRIREEFHVGTRGGGDGTSIALSYPAASTDKTKARLVVRARDGDQRTEIPADQWEFAGNQSIRMLPAGAKFEPIKIYELWYEATAPKVVGMGYAATRDVVSFLRRQQADRKGTPNPVLIDGAPPAHTMAFGISQSGRFLRHFIELGMNKDEQGRKVFDGVLAHISGAGKVFANEEFAEPSRTATEHEDRYYPENWFPFSYASMRDPVTGQNGSLFRGDASDPLVIETNTSTEYWQKGASLTHTDPLGKEDAMLPPNARAFMIAGTQHAGRSGQKPTTGACANVRNPHDPMPALRALVVALDEWVTKGRPAPASRVPSIADGTAVLASTVKMPELKNFHVVADANHIEAPVDWTNPPGSNEQSFAVASSNTYGARVSAVDADGNERAGLRLPDIVAPLATYTGWNVYAAQTDEMCDRDGSYVPFAKTAAERQARGDPRPSVVERYGSREAYVAKVKAAADALVADRLLLEPDAEAYVKAAEASDRF
ncbi:MAG: alpha/beta hydrolase domain-containing protein [Variibacter sp.]